MSSSNDDFECPNKLFLPRNNFFKLRRTSSSLTHSYIGGFSVPVINLPPSKIFPRQNFWTRIPTNFHTSDLRYLTHIPVIDTARNFSNLSDYFDDTYLIPKDTIEIAFNEENVIKRLSEVGLSSVQAQKVIKQVEKLRDGKMDESPLFRRALVSLLPEVSKEHYHALTSAMGFTYKCGDSMVRLLGLYCKAQTFGTLLIEPGAFTIHQGLCANHPKYNYNILYITDSTRHKEECSCPNPKKKFQNFKDLFWTELDFRLLATGVQMFGFDCCLISGFLGTKPCNMIRSLLKRRGIKSSLDFREEYVGICKSSSLNLKTFKPCNHDGPCSENDCACVKRNWGCTINCICDLNCLYRFNGCDCSDCSQDSCPCQRKIFECDPDLCRNCKDCSNTPIQNERVKSVKIKPSMISGWGCFAAEIIKKDDFIMEYRGEIISQGESERRGYWYDLQNSNFLFNLDDEYVIDASRVGTDIRFCNHSDEPNANVKIVFVRGELRIGVFASKDISINEEICFNYGEQYAKLLSSKSKNKRNRPRR